MKEANLFGRLVTAIVTPFDEHGRVDFRTFAELVDFQFENGADSLVVCGTTGESPCLPIHDKLALFDEALRAAAGRGKIIANVGDNCTYDSAMFAREAAALGVDGVMCVVPYYNKPSQEGMFRHFAAIAEAVPQTPVVIYNIPGRCVVNMEPQTVVRVARAHPNVRAMKQAAVEPEQDREILAEAPSDFEMFSGNDERTLDMMGLRRLRRHQHHVQRRPRRDGESGTLVRRRRRGLRTRFERAAHAADEGAVRGPEPHPGQRGPAPDRRRPVGGLRLPLVEATPEQSAALARILEASGDQLGACTSRQGAARAGGFEPRTRPRLARARTQQTTRRHWTPHGKETKRLFRQGNAPSDHSARRPRRNRQEHDGYRVRRRHGRRRRGPHVP